MAGIKQIQAASEPILTAEEVAERLKLKPSTIYELTRTRHKRPIPVLRAGKGWGSNLYTVTTAENWPRRHGIRKLFENPEMPEAPDPNPEVSDESKLNPEVSGLNQEVSAVNPEVSQLNPEVITSPNRPSSLPPLKPTALPTAHPDGTEGGQVPCGQGDKNLDLISEMASDFGAKDFTDVKSGLGTREDKNALLALAETEGCAVVRTTWKCFLDNRNFQDLRMPVVKLFLKPEEFAQFKAQAAAIVRKVDTETKTNATQADIDLKVREAPGKVEKWLDGLRASSDPDQYANDNPAPRHYVDNGGRLASIGYADEAVMDAKKRLESEQVVVDIDPFTGEPLTDVQQPSTSAEVCSTVVQ